MLRRWVVSVGPNPGRGSTHAHGPVTNTGPVTTVDANDVAEDLIAIASLMEAQVDPVIIRKALVAMAANYRGEYDG